MQAEWLESYPISVSENYCMSHHAFDTALSLEGIAGLLEVGISFREKFSSMIFFLWPGAQVPWNQSSHCKSHIYYTVLREIIFLYRSSQRKFRYFHDNVFLSYWKLVFSLLFFSLLSFSNLCRSQLLNTGRAELLARRRLTYKWNEEESARSI